MFAQQVLDLIQMPHTAVDTSYPVMVLVFHYLWFDVDSGLITVIKSSS